MKSLLLVILVICTALTGCANIRQHNLKSSTNDELCYGYGMMTNSPIAPESSLEARKDYSNELKKRGVNIESQRCMMWRVSGQAKLM